MNDSYEKEVAPYKKKSKRKGLSRANHKHTYAIVLLSTTHQYNFSVSPIVTKRPTKVCTICGRIGDVVRDPSYYDNTVHEKYAYLLEKKLSAKALSLPKWDAEGFTKFARQSELDGERSEEETT